MILTAAQDGRLIGVAPLSVEGGTAYFLGISDVCDYQDIVALPGREMAFVQALVDDLAARGVRRLDLKTLRPDAVFFKGLAQVTARRSMPVERETDDVTYEITLPGTWDDYLMQLNGKQRHEVRRKMRRLEAHGDFTYRIAANNGVLQQTTDIFLNLFQMNREDKARFMTDTMSHYFRDLIKALSEHQMLRLYFLEVAKNPAATVLCFDYGRVRYLYNSGYDAQYQELSVGVMSKVLSIQTGIEAGCGTFDFLKGNEVYKKRIGGREVPLYRCRIDLSK